jgi:hypothetical protein
MRCNVWVPAKEAVCQHLLFDVFGELLGLFANILQKCIARPSADEHDGIYWYPNKVHLHCCSQTKGLGADFAWLKAKTSAADGAIGPFAQDRDAAQQEEKEEHTDLNLRKVTIKRRKKGLHSSTKMDYMRS